MSKGRNRGYQNKKYGKFNNASVGDKAKEVLSNIDEDNKVIRMFRDFSKELDEKHDRYERIVKLSRDITIESKRIIFALHSTNTDVDDKKLSVFKDVEARLQNLMQNNFKQIAIELKGLDPHLYQKAYTNGMQEFIEAMVFFQYLKNGEIQKWEVINHNFVYKDEENDNIVLHFSHYDFILGIADFTGELMRRCINNLGIGNVEDCFNLCDCVRYINAGFLGFVQTGGLLQSIGDIVSIIEFIAFKTRIYSCTFNSSLKDLENKDILLIVLQTFKNQFQNHIQSKNCSIVNVTEYLKDDKIVKQMNNADKNVLESISRFQYDGNFKGINLISLGIISPGHKEIGRKVYTLKQSLAKMELVCYNLRIRGSEIPKHMLVSVLETQDLDNDDDEGFF